MKLLLGTFQGNERGFGFGITQDGDYYIPAGQTNGAMDGDTVELSVLPATDPRHPQSASVVRVTKRRNRTLICTYRSGRRRPFALPLNRRIPYEIQLSDRKKKSLPDRTRVVVELTDYPNRFRGPIGRIQTVLGKPTDRGIDVLSVLYEKGIRPYFPKSVLAEAEAVSRQPMDLSGRLDLRKKQIFTIDGADAKDLDDAVSVEPLGKGYLVGVHIADVSHYVTEKSRLDNVAFKRGTSIYPVDRVVPMLPKALSNHICSLHPFVERLTLSVLMQVDQNGEMLSYEIAPSVIRSVARLTYDRVQKVIDGDKSERDAHPDLTPAIDILHRLAQSLRKKRFARGSLDFDLPEPKIVLDENGHVLSVEKEVTGTANQLIEEWMLMANQTVARHLKERGLPAVYRVHESPDPAKLASAEQVFAALGYPKPKSANARDLNDLLVRARGRAEEATVHTLLLRSMAKARYAAQPLGHYGLDMSDYCHFTSPIRRYPDLVVHRILKESLKGPITAARKRELADFTITAAEQASATELIAVEAERECVRIKVAEYMSHRIGEEFTGIVSGINNQGLFVQLPNTVEGMTRFADMPDYYRFDDTRYLAVGERSGKTYRLGQQVTVTAVSADTETGRIEFCIYD